MGKDYLEALASEFCKTPHIVKTTEKQTARKIIQLIKEWTALNTGTINSNVVITEIINMYNLKEEK